MRLIGDAKRVWLFAAVLALTGGLARAQEAQYRERDVLDPQTDTWVAQPASSDQAPAGQLAQARAQLAAGEPRKARKLLTAWIAENPDHERYYEGLFLLGESYFELRDFWRAAERYQTVAENASGKLFVRANERCVDVARAFLAGEKRILWRFFRLPGYDDGVEILDRVWERMPGSHLGEFALKLKADFYFGRGDVGLAEDEYANLVQQYPSGRYVQLAMLRGAEAAEAAFPGIKFDDRPLLEAAELYRQVLAAFPPFAEREDVSPRLDGIRQQRAEKDLYIARWYERTRQPAAAEFYYRAVLADWPDTLAASEARAGLHALGLETDASALIQEAAP